MTPVQLADELGYDWAEVTLGPVDIETDDTSPRSTYALRGAPSLRERSATGNAAKAPSSSSTPSRWPTTPSQRVAAATSAEDRHRLRARVSPASSGRCPASHPEHLTATLGSSRRCARPHGVSRWLFAYPHRWPATYGEAARRPSNRLPPPDVLRSTIATGDDPLLTRPYGSPSTQRVLTLARHVRQSRARHPGACRVGARIVSDVARPSTGSLPAPDGSAAAHETNSRIRPRRRHGADRGGRADVAGREWPVRTDRPPILCLRRRARLPSPT